MTEIFTQRVRALIAAIPPGKVLSYGIIASRAGNRNGARQVARILHSSSQKFALPWHRVINKSGRISLPQNKGYALQKQLLQAEGVQFDERDRIDLEQYLWRDNDNF